MKTWIQDSGLPQKLSSILLLTFLWLAGCSEPLSDLEYLQQAKTLEAKGDTAGSIVQLKNALQQNPDNLEARWLLGKLYLDNGQGEAAEKELKQAGSLGMGGAVWSAALAEAYLLQDKHSQLLEEIRIDPYAPEANRQQLQVLQGKAHLELGNIEQAQQIFDQVLAASPEHRDALEGRAALSLQTRDFEATEKTVDKLLQLEPDSFRAWALKGQLSQARQQLEAAQEAYAKALERQPENLLVRLALIEVLIARDRLEQARDNIARVRERQPQLPPVNYLLGLVNYKEQQFEPALDALLQVLKVAPDHQPTQYLLGLVNYELGNLSQAQEFLFNYLTANPQINAARAVLAQIEIQLNRPDHAIRILEPLLRQDSDNATLLALVGNAYLLKKDYDRSAQYLQRAVGFAPQESAIRAKLALSHLGLNQIAEARTELQKVSDLGYGQQALEVAVAAYLQEGDYDAALEAAGQLLETDPDNPVAHHLLGLAYMSQGKLEQAKQSFERTLELDPSLTSAALNLSKLTLSAGGDLTREEARLRSILNVESGNSQAMLGMARITGQLGRDEESRQWLEKAWKDDPANLEAAIALARRYAGQGNYRDARQVTQTLLNDHPDNPLVRLVHGVVLLNDGSPRQAQAVLEHLVEMQPDEPQGWHLLGKAQRDSGGIEAALTSLDRALAQDQAYLPALVDKAGILLERDRQQAWEITRTIQQRHPQHDIGFRMAGELHQRQGDFSAAAENYRAAYERNPRRETAVALAEMQFRSDDSASAINTLEQWLASHPDDQTVRQQIALLQSPSQTTAAPDTRNDALLQLLRQQDYEAAVTEARRLLQDRPDNIQLLNLLASAYMGQGRRDEARQTLEQTLAMDPGNRIALLNLAQLDRQEGNPAAAQRRLLRILDDNGNDTAALQGLALLAEQARDTAAALRWHRRIWELDPTALQPGLELIGHYRRADQNEQALDVAQTLAKTHVDEPQILQVLGELLLDSGFPQGAVTQFRRLTTLTPESADAWQWLGVAQLGLGNLAEGEKALEKALSLDEDYLPAMIARVQLEVFRQQPTAALEASRALQAQHPEQSIGYRLEGDIHLQQSNLEEAIQAYRSAHDRSPDTAVTSALAHAHWMGGEAQQALALLERHLEENPDETSILLQHGSYLQELERWAPAAERYEQVLEHDADNPVALNNLAIILIEQGEERALPYAQRAVALAPEQPQFLDTLGWAQLQAGQERRALETLQKARSLAPDNPMIGYHLALAHRRLGDPDAARTILQQLLSSDEMFSKREQAEDLLQALEESAR